MDVVSGSTNNGLEIDMSNLRSSGTPSRPQGDIADEDDDPDSYPEKSTTHMGQAKMGYAKWDERTPNMRARYYLSPDHRSIAPREPLPDVDGYIEFDERIVKAIEGPNTLAALDQLIEDGVRGADLAKMNLRRYYERCEGDIGNSARTFLPKQNPCTKKNKMLFARSSTHRVHDPRVPKVPYSTAKGPTAKGGKRAKRTRRKRKRKRKFKNTRKARKSWRHH